jgi:hypothetical protein
MHLLHKAKTSYILKRREYIARSCRSNQLLTTFLLNRRHIAHGRGDTRGWGRWLEIGGMCLRTTTLLARLARMRPYLGDGRGNGSQEQASHSKGHRAGEGGQSWRSLVWMGSWSSRAGMEPGRRRRRRGGLSGGARMKDLVGI